MGTISFDNFSRVDIRIGTVVKAEVPEWSHWVIRLKVDFGSEIGERTIFAGMLKFYKSEELVNRQFPFVINIEPKKIGPEGDFSQGTMLAADLIEDKDKPEPARNASSKADAGGESKPILFSLGEPVPNGTKVR